tara:strand:- start:77 stop:202 length:126 start_codon:yes stop_codon:yes gene_type:complete
LNENIKVSQEEEVDKLQKQLGLLEDENVELKEENDRLSKKL